MRIAVLQLTRTETQPGLSAQVRRGKRECIAMNDLTTLTPGFGCTYVLREEPNIPEPLSLHLSRTFLVKIGQ